MYVSSTRCIVHEDLSEARVIGSWAVRRGDRERKEARERPTRMSISGRNKARCWGGSEGRSHVGRRVPETPCGRRERLEASMIVNHAVGDEVEMVRWM